MTVALYAEVDGTLYPLNQCHWGRFNPQGHAVGSLLGECATSSEEAHKQFTSHRQVRARETREGYTHTLVTKALWDERVGRCLRSQCRHVDVQLELDLGLNR